MSIFSQQSHRSSRGSASTRRLRRGGFTLIELLVVMSIMVIISSLLLIRQSQFDSSTLMRSLAYSVGLSVRQAQVYGSSVLGTTTAQSNCVGGTYSSSGTCYASAYGVYFNSGTPSTYSIFADLNGTYTAGEDIKFLTLGTGYVVSNFCATEIGTGIKDCWHGTAVPLAKMSIMFRRPNPDACFSTDLQTTACKAGSAPFYSSACIEIQATGGAANSTRSIYISTTGEIAILGAGTSCYP